MYLVNLLVKSKYIQNWLKHVSRDWIKCDHILKVICIMLEELSLFTHLNELYIFFIFLQLQIFFNAYLD